MKLRMVRNSYDGLLEDWKVRMIVARAMKRGFTQPEIEDALQEIVPVIMAFRYDPKKDNGNGEEAAMRVCIDRQLTLIQRGNARARKHLRRYKELSGPAGEPMTEDTAETADFSMDVKEILARLSPDERAACEAAASAASLEDAAASLNTTRYLLQRMLDGVRNRFEKAGFKG